MIIRCGLSCMLCHHTRHAELEPQHTKNAVHGLDGAVTTALLDVTHGPKRYPSQPGEFLACDERISLQVSNGIAQTPLGMCEYIVDGLLPEQHLLVGRHRFSSSVHRGGLSGRRARGSPQAFK